VKKKHNISDIFHNDWSNLTADQASILLNWQTELQLAQHEERYQDCGFTIFKIMGCIQKNNAVFKKLSAEQILDCFVDIELFEKPWYDFHVQSIQCKAWKLLSPEKKLKDLNFEQLVDADSNYTAFLSRINEPEAIVYLDKLIVSLYRPESAQGKKYEYQSVLSNEFVEDLPPDLTFQFKYLILRTYANCRNYLVTTFDDLFPASSSENESKPQDLSKMWHDMLCDLADTTAFPGMKWAKKAPIFEALYYFNKKVKEGNELKEKYRKNGTNSY